MTQRLVFGDAESIMARDQTMIENIRPLVKCRGRKRPGDPPCQLTGHVLSDRVTWDCSYHVESVETDFWGRRL